MSDVKNDGGPAFPRQNDDQHFGELGMSLRDWFAGQALAGLANESTLDEAARLTSEHARCAYRLADAMLAAREQSDDR